MINEVINEILKAEEQADAIIAEAETRAQEIRLKNEQEIAKIQAEEIDAIKTARSEVKSECERNAEEEYCKIINAARKECDDVANEKGEVADKAGEYIFGRIINGNF